MAGIAKFRQKDGSIIEVPIKWHSSEVDRMDRHQLVQMLSEMRQFAFELETSFFEPIERLERECRSLEGDHEHKKQKVIAYGGIAVVFLVLGVILRTKHISIRSILSFLSFFMGVVGAAMFLGALIGFLSNSRKYKSRYPEASRDLAWYREQKEDYLNGAGLSNLLSGYEVLPDYCLTLTALDFMISALRNGRATTLGQAVNLYEQEKKNAQQLASQLRTEAYARQAAASAESAAASARTAAINSIYDRK